MAWLYASSAAEDSAVVATDQARVAELIVTNIGGSTRFVQIFEASSLPSNGTVPLFSVALANNTTMFWDPMEGIGAGAFGSGFVVALSSTAATLTVTTGSEAVFYAR